MPQHRIHALCWMAIVAMLPSAAAAQAGKGDCPPFGRMPNYEAREQPQLRNYDAAEFRISKGDAEETVIVAGKVRKWRGRLLDNDLGRLRRALEQSRDYLFDRAGIRQDLFREP